MNALKFFLLTFQLIACALAKDEPVATFELCDLSQDRYNGYCMNSGVCYNLINKGTIDQRIFCSCPTEYTGKRCEELLLRPTFMPYLKNNKVAASGRSIITSLKESYKSSEFCSSIDCKSGEVCKYFDANMYRCPDETMDCEPYRKSSKIPICVEMNKNDACMDSLKMGNCTTYKQRFYFDAVDKTCKKFYYTGCNGNQNNFQTYKECTSTCSSVARTIPVNLAPRQITRKTSKASTHQKKTNRCEFQCSLNCPFGYKLNYRTNCPKCECQALEMTECGVPCFTPGTKKCAFAMRANSRPNCQCNSYYDGAYCHLYTKSANFTVELDKPLTLNNSIKSEVKENLRETLSRQLQIGKKSVVVNEVVNDQLNKVMVKFNVKAEDFSTASDFEKLVESVRGALNGQAAICVGNVSYALSQNCALSEEQFAIRLGSGYLVNQSNKYSEIIEHLKAELLKEYKFNPDSAISIQVTPHEFVRVDLKIKNTVLDPEFCEKSYQLQKNIRLDLFNISNFKQSKQTTVKQIVIENLEKSISQHRILQKLNLLAESAGPKSLKEISTPTLNPNFVFVTVILTCFLILVFSVGLLIVTQIKRKQISDAKKLSEAYGQKIYDNFERRRSTTEFNGYFLPNYNATSQMNLITY